MVLFYSELDSMVMASSGIEINVNISFLDGVNKRINTKSCKYKNFLVRKKLSPSLPFGSGLEVKAI